VAPWADSLFSVLAHGAAWLTLLLLVGIIVSLFVGAAPAIERFGLGFLWSTEWDPVQEKFGGLVMIYGTLMTSFIALLIAVPVSFGIALFLTELSPGWLKRPLGIAIELLAAVPSIVYGMWGLLVFGPILATYVQAPLQSLFDGVPYLGALVSGPPVADQRPTRSSMRVCARVTSAIVASTASPISRPRRLLSPRRSTTSITMTPSVCLNRIDVDRYIAVSRARASRFHTPVRLSMPAV
jgi:ABC-type phosphate transport system permease subunit